jgi:predicted O-methyltransferase YrrM
MTFKTQLIAIFVLGMASVAVIDAAITSASTFQVACIAGLLLILTTGILCMREVSRRLWLISEEMSISAERTVAECAVEAHSLAMILQRFPKCNMPTTTASMRFANLHRLLCLLDEHKPRTIVELGSGFSTMVISNWLEERKAGHLVSIDHDSDWGRVTHDALQRAQLSQRVSLIIAPLRQVTVTGESYRWYSAHERIDAIDEIDFLIIDGPPAGTGDHSQSRFPAVPFFKERLSNTAVIVLDNAARPGERSVVNRWRCLLPEFMEFCVPTLSGFCVFKRASVKDQMSPTLSDIEVVTAKVE